MATLTLLVATSTARIGDLNLRLVQIDLGLLLQKLRVQLRDEERGDFLILLDGIANIDIPFLDVSATLG